MSFRIAHITDSHLYYRVRDEADLERCDRFFEKAFYECLEHDVELVIHTGDLGGHMRYGSVVANERFKALCDRLSADSGMPIHLVRGNHDSGMGDENYQRIYGSGNYWFQHRGWLFVALDRYYRTYEWAPNAYNLSAETLDRLDAMLAEMPDDLPLCLIGHENPVGVTCYARGEAVLARLRQRNFRLHLFGHVQANYLCRYENVPWYTVTGDDIAHDTGPLTWNLVTLHDDGQVACDYQYYRTHTPAIPARLPEPGPAVRLGGDWPTQRGPHGSRRSDDALPEQAPRRAWSVSMPGGGGCGVGGPTLHERTLLIGAMTRGRFEQCTVNALDAETGAVKWSRVVDGSVEGPVVPHGRFCYVGTSAGSVYALQGADGAVAWRFNNRDNLPIGCEAVIEPTVGGGGRLHIAGNWEAYCLDLATGQALWRKLATRNGISYFAAGNAAPVVIGERVYHLRTYGAVSKTLIQSYQAADGGQMRTSMPGELKVHDQYRHASPIVHDGRLIAMADGLAVFDPEDLEHPLIHRPVAPGSAAPAAAEDRVYLSCHEWITAHDLAADGAELWRVEQEPARYHFNGAIRSKWGIEPPRGAYAAPLVCGERLLVCDAGGRVRCLDARDGTERWRLVFEHPIHAAPLISGRTLFIADYAGTVHALTW